MLRLALLVLVARVKRLLSIARSERLALANILLVVAVVVTLFGSIDAGVAAGLLLIIRLALTELLLSRCDQTKIMLCVLIIIFRCNRITRTLRIASELKILFGDMRRRYREFSRPVRWTQKPGTMDSDGDGGRRLYDYDPACACSDRFSWFAVRQPPGCNGYSAVISLNYRHVK